MRKKIISWLMVLTLLCALLPNVSVSIAAETLQSSGTMANAAGEAHAISYKLYRITSSNYRLEIDGTGAIPDLAVGKNYPWYISSTANYIKKVVIGPGITNLPNLNYKNSATSTTLRYTGILDLEIQSEHFSADITKAFASHPKLQTITFAEGVKSIDFTTGNIFYDCSRLEKLVLPASLESVNFHSTTFANCSKFTTVTLNEGSEHFYSSNNVLYTFDRSEIAFIPPAASTINPLSTVKRITAGYNINVQAMIQEEALDDNIEVVIRHYKSGISLANKDGYMGELLYADVHAKEGELPDDLLYMWVGLKGNTVDNSYTTKVAGFESPDLYLNDRELLLSPDALYGAVKITYPTLDTSDAAYLGTADCRFLVLRKIDDQLKVVQWADFTVKAEKNTYTYDAAMSYIANGNTVTMLVGESLSIQELLGRCGLTHINCNAVTISKVANTNNSPAISVNGNTITAISEEIAVGVTFDISADLCLYHNSGSCSGAELHINIITPPEITTRCADILIQNPVEGYHYFVGTKEGVLEDGKVIIRNPAPNSAHTVRMCMLNEDNMPTYSYAEIVSNGEHDFSGPIHDNGNHTHSYLCVKCKDAYGNTEPCVFDQESVQEEYKKEDASYSHKTIYYKSCDCGSCLKSETTETFGYGPSLTDERLESKITDVDDRLVGRQYKVGQEDIGRVIFPLQNSELERIQDSIVVVGGDEEKQFRISIDCAYTYFYNNTPDKLEKINAWDVGYDAFVIVEDDGSGEVDSFISGYGYYRLYADELDENNFLFDTLFIKPEQ